MEKRDLTAAELAKLEEAARLMNTSDAAREAGNREFANAAKAQAAEITRGVFTPNPPGDSKSKGR